MELKLIKFILNILPFKAVFANRIFIPFYRRKKRGILTASIIDEIKMILDPHQTMDSGMLFYSDKYDKDEINFLKKNLSPGDVFLDAGANIGFYSLVASKIVGESGLVVAIEAYPPTYERLKENINLNQFTNIKPLQIGLSDKRELLSMGISTTGNLGGNSFLSKSEARNIIQCDTLAAVLRNAQIERITFAKFDIEGFEFKVLSEFFNEGNRKMYPKFLIIEINPTIQGALSPENILYENGYILLHKFGLNYIFTLKN